MILASAKNSSGDMVPSFSVLIATAVVDFHVPFQTSPNVPAPSLVSRCRETLSISQTELPKDLNVGAFRGAATVSLQQSPFDPAVDPHKKEKRMYDLI